MPSHGVEQSPDYGLLQELTDELFEKAEMVGRLDILVVAEAYGLTADLLEVVNLLPPGNYSRQRFCDQVNSSIAGHGWGLVYGTVE